MKKSFIIFLFLIGLCSNAQEMQKYLSDTREMIDRGNYKEALQRCIWFHEHALDNGESMRGVRLSFALSDWKRLADVYPPAMDALVDIRDTKTSKIRTNGGTSDLFADVRAINRTINENTKTVALFEMLYTKYPEVAKASWRYAKEDLFAAKRYDIISKFIGNPMTEYSKLVENLERDRKLSETMKGEGEMLKTYSEDRFVEKCIELIAFSLETDDVKTAKAIQYAAIKVVNDVRLRDAIPAEKK